MKTTRVTPRVEGGSLERMVRALGKSWARRGIELARDKTTKNEGVIYLVCELQLHNLLNKYRADKRKRPNESNSPTPRS